MLSDTAPAEPYNGVFLSMNACGATRPSKELIQAGILDAWQSASPRPTIILLQEFTPPNKELEKTGGILDSLEHASGNPWTYTRQWSDTGQRDTVVLYDASEFRGQPISSVKYIQNASSIAEINKIFVGSKLNKSKKKVISYATRWAGVQLAPVIKSKSSSDHEIHYQRASRVQFLIISYHGRERREQAQEEPSSRKKKSTDNLLEVESTKTYKGTSLKSPIKKLLARDFIAEVATAAVNSNFLFNAHTDGMYTKSIPALIAGDWNAEIELIEGFSSYDASLWTCIPHPPTRDLPQLSVRCTSDGELKADIDYVVAINPQHDHELSCSVALTSVQALVHAAKYRKDKVFDHDPLLVQFRVTPRYPDGRRETAAQVLLDQRPPPRLAAQIATERIRRLTGREMRTRARTHPVSMRLEFNKQDHDGEEEHILPIEKKRVEKKKLKENKAEKAAAAAAAPPPPPSPQIGDLERTLVLCRYPKTYDLAKSAKEYSDPQLKAAVKAMALDALGVQNIRGKKIRKEDGAFDQSWWPKEVTKLATTEFDNLSDKRRVKLYNDLQRLLLAKGIGAEKVVQANNKTRRPEAKVVEEVSVQSNILIARGLGSFVRKNLSRMVSREQVREP